MIAQVSRRTALVMALTFGLFFLFSSAFNCSADTQAQKIDLLILLKETQQWSQEQGRLFMVWWAPEEFWQAALSQNPDLTPEQVENTLATARPYALIVVLDLNIVQGKPSFKPVSEIRDEVTLKDKDGVVYHPLAEEDISLEMTALMAAMRPGMTSMAGPMGRNMVFLCFPARTAKGELIADAKTKGSFSVVVGNKETRWKLPLDAVIPKVLCPKCKELCSGA